MGLTAERISNKTIHAITALSDTWQFLKDAFDFDFVKAFVYMRDRHRVYYVSCNTTPICSHGCLNIDSNQLYEYIISIVEEVAS
jgi:hypothetical protein